MAKIAEIDKEKCISRGEYTPVCKSKAVSINRKTEPKPFTGRIVEYALGVVLGKEKNTGYINFPLNIMLTVTVYPGAMPF